MSETIYDAACVLVRHIDGRHGRHILAVSRGTDLTNLGLPGGQREPGESSEEGACREVFEETGLTLTKLLLAEIYSAEVKSSTSAGRTFNVVTYEYLGFINGDMASLVSSHEGTAMWVTPEQMVAPSCVFAKYNKAVLELAGLL